MYLVNFSLFALTFKGRKGGALKSRITEGVVSSWKLFIFWERNLGGKGGFFTRMVVAFSLVFLIFISILSPALAQHYYVYVSGDKAETELKIRQLVGGWHKASTSYIPLSNDGHINGDWSKGPKDAPVKIVEFADFQCPACRKILKYFHELQSKFPEKINLTYLNYPLDMACNSEIPEPFHENACFAAEFARCAGEQEKFWDAAIYLAEYDPIENEPLDKVKEQILTESPSLGLNADLVKECLSSGRQIVKIKKDIELGNKFKITGTPAVWINGKRVSMPHPLVIERIVSDLLSKNNG
jgi:protein-disulfide isomerase